MISTGVPTELTLAAALGSLYRSGQAPLLGCFNGLDTGLPVARLLLIGLLPKGLGYEFLFEYICEIL
jgi:hypothetical protein